MTTPAYKKSGPKARPAHMTKRNPVMVKFDDNELKRLKVNANKQPLASFLRERGLANG